MNDEKTFLLRIGTVESDADDVLSTILEDLIAANVIVNYSFDTLPNVWHME